MPQAVIAVAAWVGAQVTTAVGLAGAATSVALAAGTIASTIVEVGISLAISAATAALTASQIPDPEAARTPFQQTIPSRTGLYGKARISGATLLMESKGVILYCVLALNTGQLDGYEQLYLHDDRISTVSGWVQQTADGYYGESGQLTYVETRTGLPTETPYAGLVSELPQFWSNDHRGDGIATMYMRCRHGKSEHIPRQFPNGIPKPSWVARGYRLYDWRNPAHDPDNEATWTFSQNPVLMLADYLTSMHHGMGFPWSRLIEPQLASWTEAANVCDEPVPLKAGGTQPRYRAGGMFQFMNPPSDIIGRLLQCFDGWMGPDGTGAYRIYAGKYYEPIGEEVTVYRSEVVDFSLQRFVEDERAVNQLIVAYTSPEHDYKVVETDSWSNTADIAARGDELTKPFKLEWVQWNSQARRLAKMQLARMLGARGSLKMTLAGLKLLGRRFARLQIPELSFLADLPVEIQTLEIDLQSMSVIVGWVAVDAASYTWNASVEEGNGPSGGTSTPGGGDPGDPGDPGDDGTTPFIIQITAEPGGQPSEPTDPLVRLLVQGPGSGLAWSHRWRESGDPVWTTVTNSNETYEGEGQYRIVAGTFPTGSVLEFQAAYSDGGPLSVWTESEFAFT